MTPDALQRLLEQWQNGELEIDTVLEKLRHLPYEDLGFACLDHHRSLRRGLPEVVFGEGKTPAQLESILGRMIEREGRVLCTRISSEAARALAPGLPNATHNELAKTLVAYTEPPLKLPRHGPVAVVTAGTSDLPVAEETTVSLGFLGNEVVQINDVGVAGLHRVLAARDTIDACAVAIVVAGMEGALPSVVAGLVGCPIVAVPTSVGYGASFHGLAALLGMLTSCAGGITVVNIDNGFGAAYAATLMNRVGLR